MDSASSVLSTLIILFTPILGPMGYNYKFVENIIIRLLLILFIVYSASLGYMPGLLSFLAVYTLLIERNHEVLSTYEVIRERRIHKIHEKHCQEIAKNSQPPYFERVTMDIRTTQPEKNASSANFENAEDLNDNIPRMAEAPRTNDAPNFYKSKNLL